MRRRIRRPSGLSVFQFRIFGIQKRAAALPQGGANSKLLLGQQPAEDACDVKEQRASAAGRLRAARPFQGRNARFYIQNEACVSSVFGQQLAKAGISGREERAFAGRSCGPLRFHPEPQIQDSRLIESKRFPGLLGRLFGLQPAECAQVRQRAAGLRCREAAARTVLTDRPQRWTSPQPPIFTEVVCSNLDCAAVGSPQPPPGGGLQSRAARKQARPLGCRLVLRQG